MDAKPSPHPSFKLNGFITNVVHGSFKETGRFIFKSTPWNEKREEFEASNADIIIGGHSGLPFSDRKDNKLWFNPGVIGMPANDGTPRVWYGVAEPAGEYYLFAQKPQL